LASDIAAIYF